jgi:hypothetical protein
VCDIPEYLQREIDVFRTEEVMFTQITASSFQFRDAIRFRNGRQILFQRLQQGQRVRVLSLSLAAFADSRIRMNNRSGRWEPPVPLPAAARTATKEIDDAPLTVHDWGAATV